MYTTYKLIGVYVRTANCAIGTATLSWKSLLNRAPSWPRALIYHFVKLCPISVQLTTS